MRRYTFKSVGGWYAGYFNRTRQAEAHWFIGPYRWRWIAWLKSLWGGM